MVSCSIVCLSCVMTLCRSLFHVLSYPYIPLHYYFEEMVFPLVNISLGVNRCYKLATMTTHNI